MSAYSRLIAALFRTPFSLAHMQAWDLFAHMRYVAHLQPDTLLFTQMIHACALPTPAEPERARPVHRNDHRSRDSAHCGRLQPRDPRVRALGLKGVRERGIPAGEGNARRAPRGRDTFRPDSQTFGALLEGAKRVGDLGRTRWILAEMIGVARQNPESRDVVIDERIMMHVFHVYAAYRPPFKRSMAPLVDADVDTASTVAPPSEGAASSSVEASSHEPNPSFAHLPPQNRAKVINEARAHFSRVSRSSSSLSSPPPGAAALPTLPDVHITPRLLNAYLAIFYTHASLEKAHEAFRTVFAQEGVEKEAHTLVEALERCARARRGPEHTSSIVVGFAEDAWREWVVLENSSHLSARHIQRAYAARIRIHSL
jgi:hypothetical protein